MDIILYTDGLYTLVPVTKQMLSDIALYTKVNCFDLCDILRIKLQLTTMLLLIDTLLMMAVAIFLGVSVIDL